MPEQDLFEEVRGSFEAWCVEPGSHVSHASDVELFGLLQAELPEERQAFTARRQVQKIQQRLFRDGDKGQLGAAVNLMIPEKAVPFHVAIMNSSEWCLYDSRSARSNAGSLGNVFRNHAMIRQSRLQADIRALFDGACDDVHVDVNLAVGLGKGVPTGMNPDETVSGCPAAKLYSKLIKLFTGRDHARRETVQGCREFHKPTKIHCVSLSLLLYPCNGNKAVGCPVSSAGLLRRTTKSAPRFPGNGLRGAFISARTGNLGEPASRQQIPGSALVSVDRLNRPCYGNLVMKTEDRFPASVRELRVSSRPPGRTHARITCRFTALRSLQHRFSLPIAPRVFVLPTASICLLLLLITACETVPDKPQQLESVAAFEDNTVQTGGIRVSYPAGWRALIPDGTGAENPGIVVYRTFEDSGHRPSVFQIDALSVEDDRDNRWDLVRFLAGKIAGGEDAFSALTWVEFTYHDAYVFTFDDGAGALIFEGDSRVWAVTGVGTEFINDEQTGGLQQVSAEGLELDVSDTFLSLLAGVMIDAPAVSAREYESQFLFVELERWIWLTDLADGFLIALQDSANGLRSDAPSAAVIASVRSLQTQAADEAYPIAVEHPLARFEVFEMSSVEEPSPSVRYLIGVEDPSVEVTIYGVDDEPATLLDHAAVRELLDGSLALLE